ncbi:MAG: protein kinase [Candidatus Sulfotelmatobacter sp.]|jgi:serine/threonine-protein kinase
MTLPPGTRLGPYEITAPLGAGGMGEVYKARDTRLNRIVAIKVSNEQFSERFEREAHAVAALNHSNVCTLHDVGPNYLVMEYIEGTPLRGPLPLQQALKYAAQICDALDAAHRKGITHRDLKPGNILVTKTGIKLLDFGLAKIGPDSNPLSDATLSKALTGKNEIVGTLYYMSPEQLQSQATGQEVDARSDIFSFGLVLYEMLTGKRAFDGSSPATVIAGIMERPAPSIGEMAPAALDRLLKRCLEKDPENRWQNARDLKNELEWIAQAPVDGGRAPSSTERHLPLPWIAAVVLALVAAGASWIAYRATRPAELKPLVRLEVDLGHDVYLNALGGSDIVLSPDGTRIAYLSRNHLFTRTLDQLSATELTITPGATSPFFSPDGRWIGFVAGGKLRKVSVEGGTEIALCDATSSYTGADWGEEGIIIASLRVSGGLSRVPSNGGAPTPVTELEGEERTHRWPQILPGGKAILFTAENSTVGFDDANIEVVTLTDHRRKTLQHGGTYGRYLAASGGKGYLIFVSRGTLFAVAFDAEKLETFGSPIPVLQQVSYSAMFGSAKVSFSRSGTLMYRSHELDASRVVIQWMDAAGKSQLLLDKPGLFVNPHLSPDGERLAVANDDAKSGIWVYDIRRDTLSPLTGERNGTNPVWTPDGRYIVYQAADGISFARADGGSKPEILMESREYRYPSAFSPDGKTLAFYQSGAQGFELWTVPVEREGEKLRAGKPELFHSTSFGHRGANFSADGRWLAYSSNESASSQVYVRAFPGNGGHWQISSNGGTTPIFSRSGKELFFFDATNDRIMVVSYSAKGDSFVAEKPRVWSRQSVSLTMSGAVGAQYDLAPDGKRIAVATYAAGATQQDAGHVIFLENFVDELQRKVPLNGN